ncbi:SpaA isopeptide-forming pilin-related protein [Alloscardovia omnicolens]|uniref:SpaA isopeptide-forming pilin-related protein n=1 Tax=Alloscardovia omnicolens TaxID=419015 RepID=UPI0028E69DD9|nr:SpaA isopeptide-forming pilin-related protein [Alloscardovia omnicolens]
MKLRNAVVSALLTLAMVVPMAGAAVAAEEPAPNPTSNSAPVTTETEKDVKKDTEKAESGKKAEGNSAGDKQDRAATPEVTAAPESRSAQAQPVIEAQLMDSEGKEVKAQLANPSADVDTRLETDYLVRIHAVFPAGSEKKVNVRLKYGVQYRTHKYDTTAGWYLALKENGLTEPSKQSADEDKPSKIYGTSFDDGVTTFEFQDGTQEVTFDIPVRVSWYTDSGYANFDDGMPNIPEGVSVTQSFLPESGGTVDNKVAANFHVSGLRGAVVGITSKLAQMQNKRGHISVPVDTPKAVGHDVIFNAGLSNNSEALLDDYFVALLAPAKAKYMGLGTPSPVFADDAATPKVLESGEHFTMSTGADYVVPEGSKLYVWQRSKAYVVTENGRSFNPTWRFPKADFPAGSIAEIKEIDLGVKFHNPYEQSKYLTYNANQLGKMSYEIVKPYEDVYANDVLYPEDKNNPVWEGYIADNNVYMGAPGFEHTQERTFGYFTIGNRGTANSRAKTIIIDYDMNNTHVGGVTAQTLPFLSRPYRGEEATKVTDFKVVLWNSKTNKTTEHTMENPPQRFRVQNVLGKGNHEGIFLKHIEYKVDTIPAKTAWVSYSTNLGARRDFGKEDFDSPTETFPYYGVVLNNTKIEKGRWGDDPSLFKTRIRIENTGAEEPNWHYRNQAVWDTNGDGIEEPYQYEGRSADHVTLGDTFTAFTGKSFIQGHGGVTAFHNQDIEVLKGKQKRNAEVEYFMPQDGEGIESLKAVYMVSPYGSDMSFTMKYRPVFSKYAWDTDVQEQPGGYVDGEQPDVYEVPASDALKAQYPNAKVYKLDFSKITDKEQKYRTRIWGPSVAWYEASKQMPYSIYPTFWAYTGETYLHVNYTSDPKKDKVGTVNQLMWYEFDTDTKEDLEYSSNGFVADKWDLNGNGSTEDKLGLPYGVLDIKAPTDVSAQSAAKMATQPETRYVTYDGVKKAVIGAESNVDYRLVATNPTTENVKGIQLYWPVPKKGADWGERLQPDGAFKFNMYLTGGIKSQLPEGYKVYYAKDAQPVQNELKWANFSWTEEKDTKDWKRADWDAVTMVKIISPEDSVLAPEEQQSFVFNMAVRDGENREEVNGLLNVYKSAYLRDLGSGKTWAYGEAVGIVINSGHIGGTVWFDKDNDSKLDAADAEPRIAGAKVELYDARGELVDTAVTDKNGAYSFEGLQIPTDHATLPQYSLKVYNPDTAKYSRFVAATNDMRFTADNEGNETASVADVNTGSKSANALNVGLTTSTSVKVKKNWADKNAQKKPITVKLLADGKEAKDLDGKAVPAVTLSEDGAWAGEFNNLVINNAQTDEAVKYTVEEQTPSGFVSAVTGSQKDGYTVTNTIIRGNIVVHKVSADKDDAPLAGAKFELRSGDSVIASAVTGKDGKATFKDVEFGSYTVVETAAPEGYVLNAKPLDVSVKENGKTVDAGTVSNKLIRGTVKIAKQDADSKKPLAGAKFELRSGDKVVDEATTDEDGVATFEKVAFGSYTVVETAAPEGYVLNDEAHEAVIATDGETVDAGVVLNQKIRGSIIALKKDAKSGKVLAGAQFEIRDTQGNVVRTVVSNDKGEVVASDVMYGEYILVETKAPQGYKLDDTPHKFEIRKNLEEVDLGEIKNDPIPSKVLAITGSSVAGMAVIAVLAVVTAGGLVMVRGSRAKQRKH